MVVSLLFANTPTKGGKMKSLILAVVVDVVLFISYTVLLVQHNIHKTFHRRKPSVS